MRSGSSPEPSPGATAPRRSPRSPRSSPAGRRAAAGRVQRGCEGTCRAWTSEATCRACWRARCARRLAMEALKAQAILARTFVLKFVSEKESKYKGADISTDVTEGAGLRRSKINDRIIKAVDEPGARYSVTTARSYACSTPTRGGQTELATKALDFEGQEPPYTQSVKSNDSDRAPDAVKNWTASFTAEEVGDAAAKGGRGHRHGANHRDRRKGANPAARSPSSSTDRMSAARRFASRSTRPSSSPRWSARSPSPTARCPSPAAATGTAWHEPVGRLRHGRAGRKGQGHRAAYFRQRRRRAIVGLESI